MSPQQPEIYDPTDQAGYTDGLVAHADHHLDGQVVHLLDRALQRRQVRDGDGLDGRDPGAPMAGVDGFRYTDAGNAYRLLDRHGERIRFIPRWPAWIVYDGKRWRVDPANTFVTHLASRIGSELVQHVSAVYAQPDKLRPLLNAVRRAESAAGIAATLTVAASVPGVAIDHETLDADPWLLNVRNGTIDLRSGDRRPHDPGDMLMMLAEVDHDADAVAPIWECFLERTLPDPAVRAFVRRLCGLALIGTQLEHVLAIGVGNGANGKSTMTKVIATVLGDYSIVAARDILLALKHNTHPTAIADLFRRRFAHSGELPAGAKLDEATVKELTGGDRIKARRMREDFWEFNPSHLLWLHANHKPMIEGTDDGIWRRVLLIPFDVQIPAAERDPHLAQNVIDNEASGVLTWMLDGLTDYLASGLQVPEIVTAATMHYRNDSDTVARFLAESDLEIAANNTMESTELLAIHQEWHRASGSVESEGAHYQRVVAALKEKGAINKRSKARGRYWNGVGTTP